MQADGNGFMVHILSKHEIYRNCLESKKKKRYKNKIIFWYLELETCAEQMITIQSNSNLHFPPMQVVITIAMTFIHSKYLLNVSICFHLVEIALHSSISPTLCSLGSESETLVY